MIGDPYKILGISPNVTDDEVKKAYRELSRKYHPDSYSDNPLADLAEEKFKEVQEAYQQVMKDREQGNRGSSYSGASYERSGREDSMELGAVVNYLNARRYREALTALSGISNRTARWYYYSAIANTGIGNNIMAMEHARQAVNMEPYNSEYRNFLNQIQFQGQRYQTTRNDMGGGFGTGNLCCDLWCADTLCECMGGDLCSCF